MRVRLGTSVESDVRSAPDPRREVRSFFYIAICSLFSPNRSDLTAWKSGRGSNRGRGPVPVPAHSSRLTAESRRGWDIVGTSSSSPAGCDSIRFRQECSGLWHESVSKYKRRMDS